MKPIKFVKWLGAIAALWIILSAMIEMGLHEPAAMIAVLTLFSALLLWGQQIFGSLNKAIAA